MVHTLQSSIMPLPSPPTERLEKLFHRRRCWLLADLAHILGYALISVRLFLKQIGYFRSYTHNGMWYTLRRTPRFNRDGTCLPAGRSGTIRTSAFPSTAV